MLIGLLCCLGLLLWWAPGEATLGGVVKLVYLHGALVRTAVLLLICSLPLNLAAVVTTRALWARWGRATTWTAIGAWLTHTLVSMVTTYAAWGVFVAWFEPRTRFTFGLAAVALFIALVAHLLRDARFAAGAFLVLALLVVAMMPRLGLVQHPLDPIGASSSAGIRVAYAGILAVSALIAGVLTLWLEHRLAYGSEAKGCTG